jgi:hypothetical protein
VLAGHVAVGLGSKRLDPAVPLGAAVAAAFALDLLWPLFLLLGIERVEVNPSDTAFTHLAFVSYPWSHSLVAAVLWAGAATALGKLVYRSWRTATLLGALVLSHWILDFVTHRPDLPLWPGGPVFGLAIWNNVLGTIVVEGGLFAVGIWLYVRTTRSRDAVGRWALLAVLVLIGAVWVTQPVAPPPPSATAVAWGGLVMWLLPPWGAWVERHRTGLPANGVVDG